MQKSTTMVNISRVIDNVITILFQNTGHEMFRGALDLSSINYKKNVGHVVEVLLRKIGLDWSITGRLLWWKARGCDAGSLAWKEPAATGSRRPAEARTSTLGGLDESELQHEASAVGAGSAAAQRAAEAARPEPPRVVERVRPDASDRLKRGTGWGNVPRVLSQCCVCEQEQLDALLLIGQEHAMTCSAPLRRVHDADGPFWSSHSIGVVNVFRLTCANGCSFNWSSARPLPGPPARGDSGGGAGEGEHAAPMAEEERQGAGEGEQAAPPDAPEQPTLDHAVVRRCLLRSTMHLRRTRVSCVGTKT